MRIRSAPSKTYQITERMVEELLKLHNGDRGVVQLILMGPAAIPALRRFLFRRNREGIYQPRCWAIEALSDLGAIDVLGEYLLSPRRDAIDAVEKLGDEAVFNAAARAISRTREEWVFELLIRTAEDRPYPGVLEALGTFDRKESIPLLLDGLAEDDCRPIAETALRRLGPIAKPLLQEALSRLSLPPGSETEDRQRRSIIGLLSQE